MAGRACGRARSPSATGWWRGASTPGRPCGVTCSGGWTSARAGCHRPFYHHRFLRPRALRKRYLDVIRGFGGRGRLGTVAPERRAHAGRSRAGCRRPRGRWRAGRRGRGGGGGRARSSAWRSSRPSRAGHDPRIRTSASWTARRSSAGTTASSRPSTTSRCGRSAPARSSRRPGPTSGCRRSAVLIGRA